MRSILFVCLLAVAGATAFPQEPQEIAPAQSRIIDLWITNQRDRIVQHILNNGWDPLEKSLYFFDTTVIPNLLYVKGHIKNMTVKGLSGFYINHVNYNLIMGRLDLDMVLAEIQLIVEEWEVDGRYGERGGTGKIAGTFGLQGLRIVMDALLNFIPGWPVTVHNINAALTLNDIRSDLKATWKCANCENERDISSCVNNIINVRVEELMIEHKDVINTVVGELLRWLGENMQNWG